MLLSCLVLAALAALYGFRVITYDSGKHTGVWEGLGFFSLTQLGRAMVPLAVGLWFLRRKRRLGYPEMTFLVFGISPVVSLITLIGVWGLALWAFSPTVDTLFERTMLFDGGFGILISFCC